MSKNELPNGVVCRFAKRKKWYNMPVNLKDEIGKTGRFISVS